MEKQWLTAKEVEALTGLSYMRLAKLRSDKTGPKYAKIGSSVRYDRRDVEEWMQTKMAESSNA